MYLYVYCVSPVFRRRINALPILRLRWPGIGTMEKIKTFRAFLRRFKTVPIRFLREPDEQDTQVIVGHASVSTTREVYNHIKESRKILSRDKLDSYIEHHT